VREQVGQRSGPYHVRDAIEDYLADYDERGGKAVSDARTRAEAFILPDLGSIEVEKLESRKIRAWLKNLADTPPRLRVKNGDDQRYREADESAEGVRKRKATANRVLSTLKAALNYAWREGEIASDTEWRRVRPYKDVDEPRDRYLTNDEARRLINTADPDFRQMVRGALETGCRYGELARLTVANFNPDTGTVSIRTSKSGNPRHVDLTDEGQAFFAEVTAGRAGDEIMFRKANGSTWGKSHQNRPMAEACKRAKISPPISFHILRHTWASLALMDGTPPLVVAKNLGHADTRMIERTYGHISDKYRTDAIRAGAPRFGFKPSNVEVL
jgi:integrase